VNVSLSQLANNTWLTNSAFDLIGSAVFQYMEYQRTMKVRKNTFYFSFFKVLAKLTWLTWFI
jgi:hypothetical protein